MTRSGNAHADLVADAVALCGCELTILRPRDSEALLDEEAFEHEEFLPYWAEVWPSGLALARAVCSRDLTGHRVLELGCGLALPSFAAALRGADVVASDWSPDAVRFAAENAARNAIPVRTLVAEWGRPEGLLAGAPWDLVLAADVLYEQRNVDALLSLLPRLVNERGAILVAEPGRPPARAFFAEAARRWRVTSLAEHGPPRVELVSLRMKP